MSEVNFISPVDIEVSNAEIEFITFSCASLPYKYWTNNRANSLIDKVGCVISSILSVKY